MGTKSHKTWTMDELRRLVELCSTLGYDDIVITETTSYRAWGSWSQYLDNQFDRTLDGASWRTRYLIAKRKIREAEQLKTADGFDEKVSHLLSREPGDAYTDIATTDRKTEQPKTAVDGEIEKLNAGAMETRLENSLKQLDTISPGAAETVLKIRKEMGLKMSNDILDALAAKHQHPAPTAPEKTLIDALEEEGRTGLIIALYRGQTLEQYARKLVSM